MLLRHGCWCGRGLLSRTATCSDRAYGEVSEIGSRRLGFGVCCVKGNRNWMWNWGSGDADVQWEAGVGGAVHATWYSAWTNARLDLRERVATDAGEDGASSDAVGLCVAWCRRPRPSRFAWQQRRRYPNSTSNSDFPLHNRVVYTMVTTGRLMLCRLTLYRYSKETLTPLFATETSKLRSHTSAERQEPKVTDTYM